MHLQYIEDALWNALAEAVAAKDLTAVKKLVDEFDPHRQGTYANRDYRRSRIEEVQARVQQNLREAGID